MSQTLIFSGRVIPEFHRVTLAPYNFLIDYPEAKIKGTCEIVVQLSQVSILFKTEQEITDMPTLYNALRHYASGLLDAYGYMTGKVYDIQIETAVEPNLEQFDAFQIGFTNIEQSERPLTMEDLVNDIFHRNPNLLVVLSDLHQALRNPWSTGFFCYRATEGIRQVFKYPEDKDADSPSWERLRSALQLARSYFDPLQKFANLQRHGTYPFMSGKEREDCIKRCWTVIDRFVVYMHRDEGQPLPVTEFPILS